MSVLRVRASATLAAFGPVRSTCPTAIRACACHSRAVAVSALICAVAVRSPSAALTARSCALSNSSSPSS